MSSKPARLTRHQWSEHVKNWRASNISAREFAAKHSLNAGSLQWWAGRFKRESTELTFVRVQSVESLKPMSAHANHIGMSFRWPNGIILEFGPDIDPLLLSRVLQLIGGASC